MQKIIDAPCDGVERRRALGRAIRSARGTRMTQGELGAAVGRTQASVSYWETHGELPLERVTEIERALGLPRGQLIVAAGYVSPLAGASIPSTPEGPRSAFHTEFPVLVRRWLDEFEPLIDALLVFSSIDDTMAITALLESRPLLTLRAAWATWEELLEPDEHADALLCAVTRPDLIARCRAALWGSSDEPSAPRLRAVVEPGSR